MRRNPVAGCAWPTEYCGVPELRRCTSMFCPLLRIGAPSAEPAANNAASLSTNSTGGIIEHEPSQAIALQGSGTADAPCSTSG